MHKDTQQQEATVRADKEPGIALWRKHIRAEKTRLCLCLGMSLIVQAPGGLLCHPCCFSPVLCINNLTLSRHLPRSLLQVWPGKPMHVCQRGILPTWEQLLHNWNDKTCFQLPNSLGWLSLCGGWSPSKQAWGYSVTAVIQAPSRHFQWKNLI